METIEDSLIPKDSVMMNDEIKDYLLEVAKWAKFLSILGFIGTAILVLISIFFIISGISMGKFVGTGIDSTYLGIIYLVLSILYFFPVNYLYKSSKSLKSGIYSSDQDLFTSGFKNLKSFYKFTGIATIVILSIYALIMIIILLIK
jgi:hypothetical protein